MSQLLTAINETPENYSLLPEHPLKLVTKRPTPTVSQRSTGSPDMGFLEPLLAWTAFTSSPENLGTAGQIASGWLTTRKGTQHPEELTLMLSKVLWKIEAEKKSKQT